MIRLLFFAFNPPELLSGLRVSRGEDAPGKSFT